jgi:biopolymer transport protein ExbB
MGRELTSLRATALRLALCLAAGAIAAAILWSLPGGAVARGQDEKAAADPAGPSGEPAPAFSGRKAGPAAQNAAESPLRSESINIFELALAGGIFMIPIAGMSVLAVTMTIERFFALRRQRVLPPGFVSALGELAVASGSFDPRKAYRLCQQFPSAAANVVRAMLLRVGRPVAEIESAAAQASQREADKLYANVRWLNLAASLSTMLGLIGTIQGMIMAFHRLTVMDAAADRTNVLADGIYTALVTTFAGLAVAIPALLASHFFETRILNSFRQIDELTFNLLPQLERYEGRVRFSRQAENGDAKLEEEPGPIGAGAT